MDETRLRARIAGVRVGWQHPTVNTASPARPGLAALSGALVDVSLSLLLGVLLVRDTPLLPQDARGWLVAGLILAPGVVQRVWFGLRWPGDHEPSEAKLWLKVAALGATLAIARVSVSSGVAPTLAMGAIATRFIVLTSHPAVQRIRFLGGIGVGVTISVFGIGFAQVADSSLLSGSEPGLGTAARDLLGLAAVVGAFGIIGVQSRRQSDEQQRIEQALAAERARIARELHDVVAHQMTGVILQAQGAAAVIDSDPFRATAALRSIEDGSRSALVELRRLLGVLREGEEAAGVPVADEARGTPQPTLADITDLVRAYTRSTPSADDDGEDEDAFDPDELLNRPVHDTSKRTVVRVSISDGAESAPPGLQASAHRIVQEAFTNVARHVGRASVDVRVSVVGDDLAVRVTNGPSVEAPAAQIVGAGLGLRGMRERAESLGGTFRAGPTDEGGWEVRATLPFDRTPTAVHEQNPSS